MNKQYISPFLPALAVLALFSCAKEIETETLQPDTPPVEQSAEVRTYKMSVKADKGKEATRALSLEGSTLSAKWAVGEEVTVYNETKGEALSGSLAAQSAGASTTLKGSLSGTKGIESGDVLTLKFCNPSYSTQNGTLDYIAANCDYATASVTVTGVDGEDISTDAASFENQQAIVKFTLRQTDGTTAVSALPLKVVVGDNTYTVTPSSATDELFVAVPAIDGKKLILSATEGSTDYSYVKYSAAFENGKYYTITVKMSERTVVYNETELNDAIAAGKTNILMGCDIPLENYCGIPDGKTVTLDLGGSTLSRSIDTAYDYGSVIRVSTGGTLTITDSSEDGATTRADASTTSTGTGKITGGRATVGGGICNHGTLTLAGGTIVSNLASAAGGGIYNAPSTADGTPALFIMTGGVVLGNWGEDCGGVYNYTGSSIEIYGGTIRGNTSNAGGGGIVNYGIIDIYSYTDVLIYNNTATTRGGGIWNGGELTISNNCKITGCRAGVSGGGIWNQGELTIYDNFEIADCAATVSGGGIYNEGNLVMDGMYTSIHGCSGEDCGGVYNAAGGYFYTRGANEIFDNTSNAGGGGLVNYGEAYLMGATGAVYNNYATTRGGGVWSSGILEVNGVESIYDNEAGIEGGGIYIASGGTATFYEGTVSGNSAPDGGGIYVSEGAEVSFEKTKITGNKTTGHGGGGITTYGKVFINSGSISGNIAYTQGGGIFVSSTADVSLMYGVVTDNTASGGVGGGISNYGNLTLNFATVTGNVCQTFGGGIWSQETFNMDGVIQIDENKKYNGLPSNVYLTSGKTIKVTDNLYYSNIGVSVEGVYGTVTSGYMAHNSETEHFFADLSPATSLEIVSSEATLTRSSGTPYYVERSWDGSVVKEEIKTLTEPYSIFNGSSASSLPDGSTYWYVVNESGVSRSITISSGTVNLLICDGASITGNIKINQGATLRIFGQIEDTGVINANATRSNPAIGGPAGQTGTLIVHGSSITASGASDAEIHLPAIGEGPVIIYGGNVEAYASTRSAGIGGGEESSGGPLTVYGGNVTARGGSGGGGVTDGGGGAGIGGGSHAGNALIEIYGGVVNATGKRRGAGIGGGADWSQVGAINIYGGEIYATGGSDDTGGRSGAAIGGGGLGGNGGEINISGGYVEATEYDGGAAIGGGAEGAGGVIRISGGRVLATGGSGSSLGGGNYGNNAGTIIITGGYVEAFQANSGPAIGTGYQNNMGYGTISITGGTVFAHYSDSMRDTYEMNYNSIIGHCATFDSQLTCTIGDDMRMMNGDTYAPLPWEWRNAIPNIHSWSLLIAKCEEHSSETGPCDWCMHGH